MKDLSRISTKELIAELESRDAWPPAAEVTEKNDGSISVHALEGEDRFSRRLQITAGLPGGKTRRIIFPLPWLAQVVAIAFREAGASTFRFSRRSGRHQVSAHGKHDVREFAGKLL